MDEREAKIGRIRERMVVKACHGVDSDDPEPSEEETPKDPVTQD
jgi:hypothetical protein